MYLWMPGESRVSMRGLIKERLLGVLLVVIRGLQVK